MSNEKKEHAQLLQFLLKIYTLKPLCLVLLLNDHIIIKYEINDHIISM